jgi:hypothetical protein
VVHASIFAKSASPAEEEAVRKKQAAGAAFCHRLVKAIAEQSRAIVCS